MQKWDYFYEKPAEPCARMGCDTPAAIKEGDLLLCGRHYKEHTS